MNDIATIIIVYIHNEALDPYHHGCNGHRDPWVHDGVLHVWLRHPSISPLELTSSVHSTTSDPYASDNCRNQSSWENAFQSIKSLPSKQFDHVLIRRSASCDLLSNVVPAAVNNNISVLVELNAENEMKSRIDQIELQDALVFYGNSWLAAVSFSYQPEHTSAKLMLERIEDVENMLARLGMGSPVGHIINARDLDDHL